MKYKKIMAVGARVLVFGVSVGLGLLLSELGLRALVEREQLEFAWMLSEESEESWLIDEELIFVTDYVNEQLALIDQEGGLRVVVALGDSFTQGDPYSQEDRAYPVVLERLLRSRGSVERFILWSMRGVA